MPTRVHTLAVARGLRPATGKGDARGSRPSPARERRPWAVAVIGCVVLAVVGGRGGGAQVRIPAEVNDADLVGASDGRTVRLGPASGDGRPLTVPLEVYVARVLAGEAEPKAADGAYQALAVVIRTFVLANPDRHAAVGFDLCDGTHCQVPRAATATTRRAALATAGQILTWNGAPAEVFYSSSCGGRSESADQMWPGANLPYMRSVPDDVHQDDQPWTVDLTLEDLQRRLAVVGFDGRLTAVRVDLRNESGRAARLRLVGLTPGAMPGDDFRAAIGNATLRSTAFTVEQSGERLRFTGRGYGHGVGMCVVGAGRRAVRGEGVEAILSQYFPGLHLSKTSARSFAADRSSSMPVLLSAPIRGTGGSRPGYAARPAPATLPGVVTGRTSQPVWPAIRPRSRARRSRCSGRYGGTSRRGATASPRS